MIFRLFWYGYLSSEKQLKYFLMCIRKQLLSVLSNFSQDYFKLCFCLIFLNWYQFLRWDICYCWYFVHWLDLSIFSVRLVFTCLACAWGDLFTYADTFTVAWQFWFKSSCCLHSGTLWNWLGHNVTRPWDTSVVVTGSMDGLITQFGWLSHSAHTYNKQFLVAFHVDLPVYNNWHNPSIFL